MSVEYGCVICVCREQCEPNPFGICKNFVEPKPDHDSGVTCTDCQHFTWCEQACGGVICSAFEKKGGAE